MSKHIAILGAGPGGYVAAIRAAQLGARVTVVEQQALGGVCLNWGCIPSKALLSVIELGDKLKKAEDLGILLPGPPRYDLARMVARKNKVVASLVKGIATLFNAWKIEVVEGRGVLTDARTIAVTAKDGAQRQVQADAILIATGSSWPQLAQFPVDGKMIITSKQALDLESAPPRMIILGAGVEGCECASLFSGLGTQVTMVELQSAVLPLEDEEVSVLMARELKSAASTSGRGRRFRRRRFATGWWSRISKTGVRLRRRCCWSQSGAGSNHATSARSRLESPWGGAVRFLSMTMRSPTKATSLKRTLPHEAAFNIDLSKAVQSSLSVKCSGNGPIPFVRYHSPGILNEF